MSSLGIELIHCEVKKIIEIMREDRFSREELEKLKEVFQEGINLTDDILKI